MVATTNNHDITHLPFPCDADYKVYGNGGPRFDCFSAGAMKHEIKKDQPPHWRHPCECYVFHISDDQIVAAHHIGDGWSIGKSSGGLIVETRDHPGL
jgi:hypothetical protein